jgi:3-deoxy-D-manno-octulosonate 8-phosphate phosphatase (KDO 8-P phosphatase)
LQIGFSDLMTRKSAAAIRLLVLDVDGTMTDGKLYFGPRGEALKVFHVRDGQGIKHLDAAGIQVAVISGRKSRMTAIRCRELGVEHIIQGAQDKVAAFEKLRTRLKIAAAQSACVGDDAADVPLMKVVKVAFAVADAHRDALRAAHIVTSLPGGQGAVREVCDYLLQMTSRGRSTGIGTGLKLRFAGSRFREPAGKLGAAHEKKPR